MKTIRQTVLLGVALSFVVFARANPSWAGDDSGQQKPHDLERNIRVTMKYLLYLPKDYDQKAAWPLMLFLHGAGERGDNLELVKKLGPPKLIAGGKQFPFIVASPQCPKDKWWEPLEVKTLLDEIVEKYKVDQDRIYVTGLSMGGFGTWSLAAMQPDRFAAIVPICGGGDPQWAKRFAQIPAWVFHGAKDRIVPLERSKQMVEALKKSGGDPKFTIYPEAGHDAFTETYANPQLYEWLLQQKRIPKKADGAAKSTTAWTSTFDVEKANLTHVGKNPYFIPLEPGYRLHFKGDKATLTMTVLNEMKLVDGVETRVVEEREEENGQPTEVSRNYFAIDKATNAVYYFGEDVNIYKDGKVASHEGSWLSGVNDATFGLMMPGKPKVGDKFQQEIAPKTAMDRCEIVAIGEEVKTPAGTFKNCLRVKDTSAIEKGASEKVYAPGVGLIKDDEFLLVEISRGTGKK